MPDTNVEALPTISGTVIMDWELSSYFGWGVYGLNLMLNWSLQQTAPLLTLVPVNESIIDHSPFESSLIRSIAGRSRNLQAQLQPFRGSWLSIDVPVLHALNGDFMVSEWGVGVRLSGKPSIGLTFFEATDFSAECRERAKSFPLIVAGSSWNRAILDDAGIGPSALVIQGIDPTVFHPAPKAGWFADRFVIFSGGKLEYRKGQDLVLKAFRAFAGRHPDALLVTAWASPWPGVAACLNSDPTIAPVTFRADGRIDVTAWATANGIAPGMFIDLGALPNNAMARIYREMDVGLFPNRCEGGTNLVAMECMACGVPVILSRNTGHLDLIAPDRCFPLEQQSPIAGSEHVGWGQSDVEEIVEALEAVRSDRSGSRIRAERGAQFMSTMTWGDCVRRLTEVIAPIL